MKRKQFIQAGIIFLLVFVSCNKATKDEYAVSDLDDLTLPIERANVSATARGANGFWYTGIPGYHTNGNYAGVRTTFTIPNFGGGAELKSAWCAGYNKDIFMQWGIGKHSKFGLVPIFYFYKIGVGFFDPPSRLINGGITQKVGEKIEYSFYSIGSGLWNFCRNKIVIWEVDLGFDYLDRVQLMTEQSPKIANFPKINFYPALETFNNNSWSAISEAYVEQSNWVMKVNAINNLTIGGSGAKLEVHTQLW